MYQHLYENLSGSGITNKEKLKEKAYDDEWRTNENGMLAKFNQEPLIEQALKEYSENSEADTTNNRTFWEKDDDAETTFHKIHKWGYIYYPNSCLEQACKFQVVLHGCVGLKRETLVDLTLPWASSNDIVVAFP